MDALISETILGTEQVARSDVGARCHNFPVSVSSASQPFRQSFFGGERQARKLRAQTKGRFLACERRGTAAAERSVGCFRKREVWGVHQALRANGGIGALDFGAAAPLRAGWQAYVVGCPVAAAITSFGPIESAYIARYGEPTWYAIIATAFESNRCEIFDFLGSSIWPLAATYLTNASCNLTGHGQSMPMDFDCSVESKNCHTVTPP
jgi:hypothetical protein